MRCLGGRVRVVAVRLLLETGLARAILPEIVYPEEPRRIEPTLALLERLAEPSFPLALAALLREFVDGRGALDVCRRWKLSTSDSLRVAWLIRGGGVLRKAAEMRWSALQKYMIDDGIEDLLSLEEAVAAGAGGAGGAGEPLDFVDFCREKLRLAAAVLNPQPLLTGADLIEHGISPGPVFKRLLERAWAAQLDGEIETKEEALAIVERMLQDEIE